MDHLEYFMRTGPLVNEMEKYRCRGQLRKTVFLGVDPEDTIEREFFDQTCEYVSHMQQRFYVIVTYFETVSLRRYVGRAYLGGALDQVLPERLELETFEPIEYTDKKSAPWLSLKKDSKPPKAGSSPKRGDSDSDDTPRSSRSSRSKKSSKKDKKSPKREKKSKKKERVPAPEPEPEEDVFDVSAA